MMNYDVELLAEQTLSSPKLLKVMVFHPSNRIPNEDPAMMT